jgi:hypothetical protein
MSTLIVRAVRRSTARSPVGRSPIAMRGSIRRPPFATVAATLAICIGVASTCACPIEPHITPGDETGAVHRPQREPLRPGRQPPAAPLIENRVTHRGDHPMDVHCDRHSDRVDIVERPTGPAQRQAAEASRERYQAALKQAGRTEAQFREDIRSEIERIKDDHRRKTDCRKHISYDGWIRAIAFCLTLLKI